MAGYAGYAFDVILNEQRVVQNDVNLRMVQRLSSMAVLADSEPVVITNDQPMVPAETLPVPLTPAPEQPPKDDGLGQGQQPPSKEPSLHSSGKARKSKRGRPSPPKEELATGQDEPPKDTQTHDRAESPKDQVEDPEEKTGMRSGRPSEEKTGMCSRFPDEAGMCSGS